jgi:HemY protein
MIRVLLFVLLVFALGLGFAWLAERPGDMIVTFGGYRYEVTLMVAAVLVTAVVASVMILWWLFKAIWTSPRTVSRYFRARRRDRGYQALSTGMIAAGAGDSALARKKKKEAMKLISSDQEPLILLLDAQASLLEGDHEAARTKFEAMLRDPEMRLLGLRGLYLEARRLGDADVARHYAERAAEIAPQLGWASDATLEARIAAEDWDGALALLDAQKATRMVPADEGARKRAVILTAKAMSLVERDALAAKNAGIEANRLAPDLVPAAIVAAKALFRLGDLRKGAKILEAAWRKHAHPEIAEVYVHARHGDSVGDRLYRAKKLQSQKQNNSESAFAVAHAALEAGELTLARQAAEESIRIAPREGAFLLMADIEEADTGDQGRIRQWLSRAVRAPRDPVWIADGVVSERWAPVSPVTGRLDAFEWRAPVEKAGRLIEQDEDDRDLARPPVMLPIATPIVPEPAAAKETLEAETIVIEPTAAPSPANGAGAEPSAPEPKPETVETPTDATPRAALPPEPAANANEEKAAAGKAADLGAEGDADRKIDIADMPRPDDPGVDPEAEEEAKAKRFRLF